MEQWKPMACTSLAIAATAAPAVGTAAVRCSRIADESAHYSM